MKKPNNENGKNLAGVHTHTHTHTGSVSGYLTYKKIDIEKMKAHVLYMFFNDLENV